MIIEINSPRYYFLLFVEKTKRVIKNQLSVEDHLIRIKMQLIRKDIVHIDKARQRNNCAH